MQNHELIEALLRYEATLTEGSVLWEITVRTIKELQRENPFGRHSENAFPIHIGIKTIHKSGRRFGSLREASAVLNIEYQSLKRDINSRLHRFGLEILEP